MAEFSSRSQRVRELCRRLAPFIGKKAEEINFAYLAEDKTGKEQIEVYLEALVSQYLREKSLDGESNLVPPNASLAAGEYAIGDIIYGGRKMGNFGLREKEWIQHLGIFGRTGAGKTNMGFQVLRQLRAHGKPFLVFDWKRNYRDLTTLPEFKDVKVYTPGRDISPLSFNPLIPPPGTPPKTWLKKIIEVVAHAYLLGNGVLFLLQQSVDAVYEKFGLYEGLISRFPTFRDVLDEAQRRDSKGREAGWLASTLRALSSLCFGDMDSVVNQGGSLGVGDLLEQSAILELDALTQSDKVFFIQSMLLWIHHYRMMEGQRETFKHALVIEEAHHVLSGERRSLVGGQTVMDITFREIREFGESIIILDQHPSQISLPALGNTYTTICLNLKHSRDVSAMGQCMLLEGEEKDLLGTLEVGQAVVKLQGRIPRPFMIEIPEFPLRKGTVLDEEVAARMGGKVQPAKASSALRGARQPNRGGQTPGPPSLDVYMLHDIEEYPESGIAGRYKRLSISVRQGEKLRARLAKEGLITDTKEQTQTGSIRRIRLTEKGRTNQFLSSDK
ncbi:ATP-binding protein [bacterium]|nr:ATP-binding protein [bacterium]